MRGGEGGSGGAVTVMCSLNDVLQTACGGDVKAIMFKSLCALNDFSETL